MHHDQICLTKIQLSKLRISFISINFTNIDDKLKKEFFFRTNTQD